MRLTAFSVENYRSITTARKVPLAQYSLLIGANNEGKSNILHALALGMDVLANWTSTARRMPDGSIVRTAPRYSAFRSNLKYEWASDFPIGKQKSKSTAGQTKITLEFILDEAEREEFKDRIRSSLNGTLPIQIVFSQDGGVSLSVQKPGTGHLTLNKKSARIAEFVSRKIQFVYVPAIRTSASASRIISNLVEAEISKVEADPRYQEALATIEEIQNPVFNEIAKSIHRSIRGFLPNVKFVELRPKREARAMALRREVDILVDDGNLTRLDRKGDGVQSLAALALMRQSADHKTSGVSRIIAIEEPESHLHPRAVHELRSVIESLAEDNQIVLTSHSPLFVKVQDISNTVIVKDSRAQCARTVSEIREALGVRFSDNLQNAKVIVLVEGKDDIRSLSAIVSHISPVVSRALEDGVIVFDDLGGAGSLGQKASFYQAGACQIQCFIDDDRAGKAAVDKAIAAKALHIADINLSSLPGRIEAELEDLYDVTVYKDAFFEEFMVDVSQKIKGKQNLKWSDRMEVLFHQSGKPWSEQIKAEVKSWLSEYAEENCATIIRGATADALNSFITALERKIGEA